MDTSPESFVSHIVKQSMDDALQCIKDTNNSFCGERISLICEKPENDLYASEELIDMKSLSFAGLNLGVNSPATVSTCVLLNQDVGLPLCVTTLPRYFTQIRKEPFQQTTSLYKKKRHNDSVLFEESDINSVSNDIVVSTILNSLRYVENSVISEPLTLNEYAKEIVSGALVAAYLHISELPIFTRTVSTPSFTPSIFSSCSLVGCGSAPDEQSAEFYLCDSFLPAIFARQDRIDARNSARARHWLNNKKYPKKLKKERRLAKRLKNSFSSEPQVFPTFEDMGFKLASAFEELDPAIYCTVCMEVYYRPHTCKPCDHKFCELCLRRLAMHNDEKELTTSCPICRSPIQECIFDQELDHELKNTYRQELARRRRNKISGHAANYPLPGRGWTIRKQDIRTAITNRRRNPFPFYRTCYIRYKTLVVSFLLNLLTFVLLSLVAAVLKWQNTELRIVDWYCDLVIGLINYQTLEPTAQILVTNNMVVFLIAFIMTFLTINYFFRKYQHTAIVI